MQVLILSNEPVLASDHPEADSEEWVRTAVADVAERLGAGGCDVTALRAGRDMGALWSEIAAIRPDVVFNLFEGLADQPESEVAVARLLEQIGVPFTGSPPGALELALNKGAAQRCLRRAGLPVPWFREVSELPPTDVSLAWPVIVKPARRDASEGIDQQSVVTSAAELTERVARLLQHYGPPVLIEQFVPGREFTVSLIELPALVTLPIAEVLFTRSAAAPWPILSYAAKWHPESADYAATDMQHAAPLAPALAEQLTALAMRAYHALGCRDYARIDLRLNAAGEPLILDVNPNPDLSPTACFAYALKAAGLDRTQFLARLVQQAAGRRDPVSLSH